MSRPGNSDTATSTGPASNPAAVSAPRPHDRGDSRPYTGSDAASPVALIGMAARHLRRLPCHSARPADGIAVRRWGVHDPARESPPRGTRQVASRGR